MTPSRPLPSAGQFFSGVLLAGGLLLGSAFALLIPLAFRSTERNLYFAIALVSGPLMILITTLVARQKSIAFWVGALSTLVPVLLLAVLLLIFAIVSG